MEKLLQKFLESDVIEEVRGRQRTFREDGSHLYRFVTEPSFLNFIRSPSSTPGHGGSAGIACDHVSTLGGGSTGDSMCENLSTLGGGSTASSMCENLSTLEGSNTGDSASGDVCFTKKLALVCSDESASPQAKFTKAMPVRHSQVTPTRHHLATPTKFPHPVTPKRLSVRDVSCSSSKPSPELVARVWKEMALTRLEGRHSQRQ